MPAGAATGATGAKNEMRLRWSPVPHTGSTGFQGLGLPGAGPCTLPAGTIVIAQEHKGSKEGLGGYRFSPELQNGCGHIYIYICDNLSLAPSLPASLPSLFFTILSAPLSGSAGATRGNTINCKNGDGGDDVHGDRDGSYCIYTSYAGGANEGPQDHMEWVTQGLRMGFQVKLQGDPEGSL